MLTKITLDLNSRKTWRQKLLYSFATLHTPSVYIYTHTHIHAHTTHTYIHINTHTHTLPHASIHIKCDLSLERGLKESGFH